MEHYDSQIQGYFFSIPIKKICRNVLAKDMAACVQPAIQQPTPVMLTRGSRGCLGRLLKDALQEKTLWTAPPPRSPGDAQSRGPPCGRGSSIRPCRSFFSRALAFARCSWKVRSCVFLPPPACVTAGQQRTVLMPLDGTGGPTAAHKALNTLPHLLQLQLLHPFLLFSHSVVSDTL